MSAKISQEDCNGCGKCVDICPGDVIVLLAAPEVAQVRYPEECWYCGSCRGECPSNAISYEF